MAIDPLCKQFGDILEIPPQIINGVCTLMTVLNIPVTILERPSRSALTVPMMFSFESIDNSIHFAHKVRHAISVLKH